MLALVVKFQTAIMIPTCRLAKLVQDLRVIIMPQSFDQRDKRKAANQMLIASQEAIYVFQYLALMREPAQDYLTSIIDSVGERLDTFVPLLILGI